MSGKRVARRAGRKTAGGADPWTLWTRLWTAQTEAGLAAAEVIARRTALAAAGALTAEESARMVLEKQTAFVAGWGAWAGAVAAGAPLAAALDHAGRPAAKAVRANARRLRR